MGPMTRHGKAGFTVFDYNFLNPTLPNLLEFVSSVFSIFKKKWRTCLTQFLLYLGFTCEMWHPNVYSDGTLCLDIVQDNWSPIYTVASILTSIQSLLTDPNPASPANPEAAKMFTENPKEYRKRVRRVATRSLEQ